MSNEHVGTSAPEGIWDETPADMEYLAHLLGDRAGILLESKRSLFVESRLLDLLYREKIGTVGQLVSRLRGAPESYLHRLVVEALAIQETSFFRDQHPFAALKTVLLPWLMKNRREEKHLSLWSAAASTGQEAYSLAMVLDEIVPARGGWRIDILGTDLSQENIKKARLGDYTQFEVNRGLPAALMLKYFTKTGEGWTVREELRRRVVFQELNLIDPWPSLPLMDVVFLRNVLMYLDVRRRRQIIARVRQVMRPDGFLVLGAGESLTPEDGYHLYRWKSMDVYQPQEAQEYPSELSKVETK
jgi:chemotaxis protein methyltransferase CheR